MLTWRRNDGKALCESGPEDEAGGFDGAAGAGRLGENSGGGVVVLGGGLSGFDFLPPEGAGAVAANPGLAAALALPDGALGGTDPGEAAEGSAAAAAAEPTTAGLDLFRPPDPAGAIPGWVEAFMERRRLHLRAAGSLMRHGEALWPVPLRFRLRVVSPGLFGGCGSGVGWDDVG